MVKRMCYLLSYLSKICLEPVGFVQTDAVGNEVRDKNVISKLVFHDRYTEALEGVEEFSHIFVLFWLHLTSSEDRLVMKVRPRGRSDMPLLGIFATRTPHRINPIGLTCVKILNLERNVVTVQGLDAYDGTPILDIKPFDSWDTTEDFRVPEWWTKLEQEKTNKI